MNENSRCFIKEKGGGYREITYGELQKRRKLFNIYKNKKFINVQDMLFEVNKEEFNKYHNEEEKAKYKYKTEKRITIISIDNCLDEIRGKDFIPDLGIDIEKDTERKIELQKLNNALLSLDDKEYEIIKKLFFEKISLRKYAASTGIPKTTLSRKTKKILDKLKKSIEN